MTSVLFKNIHYLPMNIMTSDKLVKVHCNILIVKTRFDDVVSALKWKVYYLM